MFGTAVHERTKISLLREWRAINRGRDSGYRHPEHINEVFPETGHEFKKVQFGGHSIAPLLGDCKQSKERIK